MRFEVTKYQNEPQGNNNNLPATTTNNTITNCTPTNNNTTNLPTAINNNTFANATTTNNSSNLTNINNTTLFSSSSTPTHLNSRNTYPFTNRNSHPIFEINDFSDQIDTINEDVEEDNDQESAIKIQIYSDEDQNSLEKEAFLSALKKSSKPTSPLKLDINNHNNKIDNNSNNSNNSNNFLNIDGTFNNISPSSSHILLPATTVPSQKNDFLPEIAYLPPLTINTADSNTKEMARQGRMIARSKNKSKRLVLKDGSCNVTTSNITERNKKYLVDIFTTLVDMKWRYNCLMFVSGFLGSWLFFAVVYFIVVIIHGDHRNYLQIDWKPCFSNVHDFYTAFLFSLETQQTIGYGYRGMDVHCPYTIGILMTQCCVGVFIQSFTAGIIFAKLSQPKRRAHTLLFSRKSVICSRDGEYCLLFRVGNMRKSHFVGTSIRAFIVQDKFTKEGECIPLWQNPLEIQAESCNDDDFVFLVWPVTIVHKINDKSPLWNISPLKLLQEHFEIIVVLEGIVESTGMTTQVRTSYLNTEILWGHRLAPLLTYQKENGQYKIDYSQFHAVIPIQSMSHHSAKEHRRKKESEDETASKTTEMEAFNFGYISPEFNTWKQENWKLSMLRRVKGGMKFRGHKSFKKDLPNLDRRMSASTGALRVLKSRHIL